MKSRKIWRTVLLILGILAGAWVFGALLLPVLWPFAAGGAAGSVLRYLFTLIPVKSVFPFQTFVVNMLGCFAIGVVTTLASLAVQKVSFRFSPLVVLFLKTGVCGGFTTFSTFALESANFVSEKNFFIAALYAFSSLILGILCVIAGQNCIR